MPRGDCGLMCQVRLSINFFAASTTYCSASSLESNLSDIPSTLKNLTKCSTVVVLNLRFPGPVSRSRGLKDFKLDHLTLIFLLLHVLRLLFRSAIGGHLPFLLLLSGAFEIPSRSGGTEPKPGPLTAFLISRSSQARGPIGKALL